jgi:hypothetical protein
MFSELGRVAVIRVVFCRLMRRLFPVKSSNNNTNYEHTKLGRNLVYAMRFKMRAIPIGIVHEESK